MIRRKDFFLPSAKGNHRIRQVYLSESFSGEPFVFLHDALGSITQWKTFPQEVVEYTQRSAFLIERLGHGQSDPLPSARTSDYLHHEASVVLPALLDQLGIQTPMLIGHSDGGTIALIYGAQSSPKAVITIAAHTMVEDCTLEGIREAVAKQQSLTEKLRPYHGAKTEALFDAWAKTWLDPAFRDWNILKELPRINCPVLAIQGDDDAYGSMAQINSLVDRIAGPVEVEIIPGGGHMPHLQFSEEVGKRIGAFILQELDMGK